MTHTLHLTTISSRIFLETPRQCIRIPHSLHDNIREDILLESQLLLLSFAIGIQDAAAWPTYGCFASNQTGNMLFLALGGAGLATTADYNFRNLGMSLGAFIAGALVMGQIGNYVGVRQRWWLLLSSFVQSGLVFSAAGVSERANALVTLFMLAFASGAQVAMGRALKITDITTAMATAAYVDVVIDPGLLKGRNRGRNRRVLFLGLLMAGCFVGAVLVKVVGERGTLVVSGGCKIVVMVGFLFSRRVDMDC
ncbi:hypothetical protein BO94DRAFT_567242 [Aspergillus sclerotioniger CBS 115572]|uniref:DUF1275 domain protein n=1 Tax=Aspergillus sclerotioniger CBS 115572 TaxID=1450535 RepID=A0A317W8L5_9EURO|nr:hypothetical protein BO94DRAFT_567242 [Aspergillus sclerotioniger CBS 115572]PWY81572.1 hypothetical protein BO94DRAFT_567242 [Aspergillus sclerotioniger CBS 115572]